MFIDIYIIILLFISGLVASKFLIIIGNTLPLKHHHISYCECPNNYKVKDLIPLFSLIKSKNKCPYCHKGIPILFIFLEVLTPIIYSLSYVLYGYSYEMLAMIIISSLMIIIYVSDHKYYIINDSPLLISSIIILLLKYLFFGLQTLYLSIVSGVLLFALLYILRLLGNKIFKRESLGGGDVKLAGFFGVCLGIKLSVVSVLLGALLSFPKAIYYFATHRNDEIPFGPYLITGLFIVFLFQNEINQFINLIIK